MLIELLGPPRLVKPPAEYTNYGDPLETYPIDTARLRRVVELVADKAEWGKKLPPRHGQGIAVHRSFLSYVANVLEVAVDDKGKVIVQGVTHEDDCWFDCCTARTPS